MLMEEIIQTLRERGSELREPIAVGKMKPMAFSCWLSPQGATTNHIARAVEHCPDELRKFWEITSSAKLFEDRSYGQRGLNILAPLEAEAETQKRKEARPSEFTLGGLVIGRFLGDSDLLMIRCDADASDFGAVLIALPIDPRGDWYHPATGFEDFPKKYLEARGDKFWERRG